MTDQLFKSTPAFLLFCVLVAFAYFWGVMSIQHYLPSHGLYIGLYVALILSVALSVFFVSGRIKSVSYGVLLWFGLFVLVLVQPLLHQTPYPDRLIFPSAGIFLMTLFGLAIGQLDDGQKRQMVHYMAFVVCLCGILTVASQLVQLFKIRPLMGVLVFSPSGERLVGNVAQVNQAAFVSCLGMASVAYFVHYYRTLSVGFWLIVAVLMSFLGVGLGLSASRGGLILAAAALASLALFYKADYKWRLLPVLGLAVCVMIGYQMGTWLMNTHLNTQTSAVGRMVGENSLHLRTSLLHQAKLAFLDNPVMGNGFDTMNHFGLQHFDKLGWFTSADHTHNLIGQFGAELGLIGLLVLLGFVGILLKNLRFNLPAHLAFAYGALLVIGLYSLSEYPLWYLKFLMLAVFFIAVVDNSKITRTPNLKPLACFLSVGIALASIFYIYHYKAYHQMAHTIKNTKISQDKKIAQYNSLPDVLGYHKYKELSWFLMMPIATQKTQLQDQANLGDRVLTQFLSASMLTKQAQILVNLGEYERADRLYQATCIFGSHTFCQVAVDNLYKNNAIAPQIYQPRLEQFANWHLTYFGKPMPVAINKPEQTTKHKKSPQIAISTVQSTQKNP